MFYSNLQRVASCQQIRKLGDHRSLTSCFEYFSLLRQRSHFEYFFGEAMRGLTCPTKSARVYSSARSAEIHIGSTASEGSGRKVDLRGKPKRDPIVTARGWQGGRMLERTRLFGTVTVVVFWKG